MGYAKAAERGHPMAMTNVGSMHLYGDGGHRKNATLAADWFRKAALQGEKIAMFQLGKLLIEGRGIAADELEAEQWLQESAKQGHSGAEQAIKRLREWRLKTRDV